MNLRDLRYLVAVADERHFGRAAERCHVSQPTLSAQIKKLEEYLGITLFERHPKSVEITEVGYRIIEQARLSLEHADAMTRLAIAYRDPLSGTLDIGAIPTLCPYLMPRILAAIHRSAPLTKLIFSEDVTESLEARLRAGEIDAALLATPIQDANFIDVPLFFEPFLLAIPSDHWLVDRAEIGEAELREADLLLLNDGHCLREQALAICHSATKANGSANAAPNPNVSDVRATSLQTLMHMVAAGYGSTLLPALAVDQWRGMDNIKIRELKVANAGRRIAIVVRKSFPRMAAIKTVADAIRNALPDSVQVLSA